MYVVSSYLMATQGVLTYLASMSELQFLCMSLRTDSVTRSTTSQWQIRSFVSLNLKVAAYNLLGYRLDVGDSI
jgi:hypothetical protein